MPLTDPIARAAYKAAWYQRNKERLNAKNADWVRANIERRKEIAREYAKRKRAANQKPPKVRLWTPERRRQKLRERMALNPEKFKAYDAKRRADGYFSQWKRDNKDKVNAATRRRRAIIKNTNGGHHALDIVALRKAARGKCYWCRGPHGERFEVDHIWPLALGGDDRLGNLCISCQRCNRAKSKKPPTEFAGVLL